MLSWVFHFSRWAEWVSALFLLVIALRFSGSAFVNVVESKLESVAAPPETRGIAPSMPGSGMPDPPQSATELLKALKDHLPPLPDGKSGLSQPSGGQRKYENGDAVQVQLMVSLGTDRSEVLVDGSLVGKTPFIGDVACRVGDTLKIDVIPAKGMPITLERLCVPEVIRIEAANAQAPAQR